MEYIVGFVLLLGVLIAIHEFGHFIVAKACGVRVEVFSIGMGKKILSLRRGETEYALSVFPMGGYVKLTGQDPREEVPPELNHKSFRNKPLWQRAAIVLAGPIFNAILAVLIMSGLYSAGAPAPMAVIRRLEANSPAQQAGFQVGDRIVRITQENGKSQRVRELRDLETALAPNAGKSLKFSIERPGQEQTVEISHTVSLGNARDSTTGVVSLQGVLEGAEYRSLLPVVAVASEKSWAGQRQLPASFWIQELRYPAGGIEEVITPTTLRELEDAWHKAALAQRDAPSGRILLRGQKVELSESENAKDDKNKKSTEDESQSFTLAWTLKNDRAPESLAAAGMLSHEFVVLSAKAGSPAERLGLKSGDIITRLGGQPVHSFNSFRERIQRIAGAGEKIRLSWLRKGVEIEASMQPEVVSVTDPLTETAKNQFQIGAAFLPLQNEAEQGIVKADGLPDAVYLGFTKSVDLTVSMLRSFYHLFKGDIAFKTLGGPILIGKIAGESFKRGIDHFLRMMAFISLNLFVLNLLPIPVLDGGHLVLYVVEAIRRKPLSTRVIEAWSTTGFFILMGLVAVVFFNDLNRLGLFKFFSS